jgi:hypothetical protein
MDNTKETNHESDLAVDNPEDDLGFNDAACKLDGLIQLMSFFENPANVSVDGIRGIGEILQDILCDFERVFGDDIHHISHTCKLDGLTELMVFYSGDYYFTDTAVHGIGKILQDILNGLRRFQQRTGNGR